MRRLALFAALLVAAPAWAADGDLDRSVAAIARIGSAGSPSFSPDGTRIAFVSNRSGSPQVWVMPAAGGDAKQITTLTDPVQSVHWSPTNDDLAIDVAPGGGLNVQIYVLKPDGSALRRLTPGGQENNSLAGWTKDGRFLRAGSNQRDPAAFDALLLDPRTGTSKAIVAKAGNNGVLDVSMDGKYAVVTRLISRGDNNLYLVDMKSGAETLLTPHEGTGSFYWGQFSPDGNRVYVSTNGGRDRIAFGYVELDKSHKPGPMKIVASRDDAEGDGAILDRQGKRAALLWNVAGRSELSFLDTATGKVSPAPKLPADVTYTLRFSKDGSRLAVVATGSAITTDIHVLDIASGTFTRLTNSPHDGVDLASFVEPTLVTYKAHDGLDLSGWLTRPRGVTGPGPVVFSFHGGPEGQSRPGLSDVTQALVARGISVFAPNVRGSTGFGKKFMNLDNGALRVNSVRDIKASVDHLVATGVAQPGRLGIVGGSYGGYMVMAGVTEYPDMFAAGANLFGIVNFATFFKHTQPWMAAISKVEYGDPDKEAAMLASLSPIHKLDRIKTPLIVLHGANDTNVPVIEAEQIVASLKGRNVPVEYVLFPDEGHGWRKMPNRVKSTVSIVQFFDRYLNGKPPG
ncbi:alpha/beta hydrolase family protein [Roseiterribacter gracilis]|uniref:Peptidase S9 n=1 Tax=Roseiterribacter gracilis TaxID=2812848 RepID=A0A8S8XGH2_9PROT|nr:peptidase S9 [Rhodospirillales bacterium TMPK1]